MLPERDLPLRVVGAQAFFDFLGPQDEPWLRVLLAEMARFEGRRWRELRERIAEPLPCDAPHFKRRCATRVLARLWRRERVAVVAPLEARARLFAAAATTDESRDEIVGRVAATLGVAPADLEESLFGDLPGERRMRAPVPAPGANEVALRTNLAIAQAVLMRSAQVTLSVRGGVRPIVRLAKLLGLLCVAKQVSPDAEPVLEISGPYTIFRHTLLYGRALAALLPHLAWCARFELQASAALRGRVVDVGLESGSPVFPAAPPRPFDSAVEERFARDFAAAAPDWHVLREPEPLATGSTLIFPDFLLQHRIHQQRRVLLEIVGFWTPDYLASKIARLRETAVPNIILCVDENKACIESELPAAWPVVRYRRRVDALAVLREVKRIAGGSG